VTALLLDEMLSPTIAQKLRERGHDVYAISERPDLVGLPDEQVLGLGAVEARAVVTLNIADFAALHADWQARGRGHAGIVFVSNAAFPKTVRSPVRSCGRSTLPSARSRYPGAISRCSCGADSAACPVRRRPAITDRAQDQGAKIPQKPAERAVYRHLDQGRRACWVP
jgi:hypothetical protein